MSKLPPCNKQTAKTHQTKETAARRRREDAVVQGTLLAVTSIISAEKSFGHTSELLKKKP